MFFGICPICPNLGRGGKGGREGGREGGSDDGMKGR